MYLTQYILIIYYTHHDDLEYPLCEILYVGFQFCPAFEDNVLSSLNPRKLKAIRKRIAFNMCLIITIVLSILYEVTAREIFIPYL